MERKGVLVHDKFWVEHAHTRKGRGTRVLGSLSPSLGIRIYLSHGFPLLTTLMAEGRRCSRVSVTMSQVLSAFPCTNSGACFRIGSPSSHSWGPVPSTRGQAPEGTGPSALRHCLPVCLYHQGSPVGAALPGTRKCLSRPPCPHPRGSCVGLAGGCTYNLSPEHG